MPEADRRKTAVLPSEMPSVVEQEPAVRRIVRRPRVKHETSFQERLFAAAQEARAQAELHAGSDRDHLLFKAQQCEVAARIDKWASSKESELHPDDLDFAKKPKL